MVTKRCTCMSLLPSLGPFLELHLLPFNYFCKWIDEKNDLLMTSSSLIFINVSWNWLLANTERIARLCYHCIFTTYFLEFSWSSNVMGSMLDVPTKINQDYEIPLSLTRRGTRMKKTSVPFCWETELTYIYHTISRKFRIF